MVSLQQFVAMIKTDFLTDFLTEISAENNFDEGLRFTYYVPSFNRRDWGCVYVRFYVSNVIYRISTKIKVKRAFWNNGIINYPKDSLMSEKILMRKVDSYLLSLADRVDSVYCDYLRNETTIDKLTLVNNIKNTINPMSRKTKRPQSLISMLKLTVSDSTKSYSTSTSDSNRDYINKFAAFLKVRKLKDDISTLNQKTINDFRDWLVSSVAATTANNILTNFLRFIKDCERKFDVDFGIDKDRIQKIVDSRSSEEKRGNFYALTHEDIDKLANLQLTKTKARIRDLFLLQCFTSVRFADLPQLLDPKNRIEKNGIVYSTFLSKKTDTRYLIPLNDTELYPQTLEILNKYVELKKIPTNYNTRVKEIAQEANLDYVINHTSNKGGKKTTKQMFVYEKISSHWGRHTFITNAQRYFGISPDKIRLITSHSDTNMIEKVYTNTTLGDNIDILHSALRKQSENTQSNNSTETTPSEKNNYNIDGINEAKSVMRYLQIPFDDNITFEEAISEIATEQAKLIENYGVNIPTLKVLFNLTQPLSKRINALRSVLKSLE